MTGKPTIPPHGVPGGGRRLDVHKLISPALAAAHLLAFRLAVGHGPWTPRSAAWPATAFCVLAFLLSRDLLTSRRDQRLPDVAASMAWAAAGCLEAGWLSHAVASSRIVPATLFPLFGYMLPLAEAIGFALGASAWLLVAFTGRGSAAHWDAGILAMAVLGVAAGQAVRRKLSAAGSMRDEVRKAISESRSILMPWESAGKGGEEPEALVNMDDEGILRWRADLEEGIRRVLEGILPMTGADGIHYVTPPPAMGQPFRLGPSVHAESRGEVLSGLSIPDSFVPVREALIFGRTFFADGDDADIWPVGAAHGALRLSGMAAVPVIIEGHARGAIFAFRLGNETWAEPVIQALDMGAYFIAREHERERQSYRRSRYQAQQETIRRIWRRIARVAERGDSEGDDVDGSRLAVYRSVAEEVRRLLALDRVLLIEIDGDTKRGGRVAWEEGPGTSGPREGLVPLEETYVAWILKNGVHRIFSDLRRSPPKHPVLPGPLSDPSVQACMLVPLTGAGGFRGVLACASRDDRSFDVRDVEAVKEVLTIMRMGISHATRMETLEKQARRDGLTGLFNQRTFRQTLSNVLGRLDKRYPGAVAMLDLDHFKRINDTYGHPAGDEVLRKVAGVIQKTIRKMDFAGRYGGEEFAIFLHMADREKAEQGAERLRLMISQAKFFFGGKEVRVTASIGVACCPEHGTRAEELLQRADEALYVSKENGRNQVTIYESRNISH